MQTFIPYADFHRTAQCLDGRRLSNQRREALTLIRGGWRHHTASKIWQGHMFWLCLYAVAICEECIQRGYKDSLGMFMVEANRFPDTGPPPWLGWKEMHDSHKSNLLRKKPEHYAQFKWDVPDDLPYVWPSTGFK